MRRLLLPLGLAVLSVGIGTALLLADAQDEARKLFDSVYAPKVKAARTPAEKVATAKEMMDGAKGAADHPALVKLLCDQAYDLTSTFADGWPVAAEAMQLLMQTAEYRAAAAEKLVAVYQRMLAAAKPADRAAISDHLIDLYVADAEQATEKNQHAEALVLMRKAVTAAATARSPRLEELRGRVEVLTGRQKAAARVAALEERLLRDANDAEAAKELVMLHLLDLDEPALTGRTLDRVKDEKIRTIATLAMKESDALSAEECLQLADWHREQWVAAGTSAGGKTVALSRAVALYQQFLAAEKSEGLARKRVELTLADLEKQLEKSGGGASTPGASPPVSVPRPRSPVTGKGEPADRGLIAEFFTDKSFGTVAAVEIVRRPLLGLGDAAAAPGGRHNQFSARLTGFIEMPVTGDYAFQLHHDDGATMWLDGKEMTQSNSHGGSEFTAALKKGKIPLRIDWLENAEKMHLALNWKVGGVGPYVPVPSSACSFDPKLAPKIEARRPSGPRKPGLQAVYFSDMAFEKPVAKRVDANISFNWDMESPVPGTLDAFTVTWTGYLLVPKAGEYALSAHVDDSVKVKLDGKVVLWVSGNVYGEEKIHLAEGLHALDVSYGDSGQRAHVKLLWKTPNESKAIEIPASAYFHSVP